ncbi:hypothetical protein BCU68_09480 [Vibrio sp. 10N.286.49.B3]|uniref:hypothetical protein n=1 Tax=Vibrio sp. 10N.286.49.B3 TaxID=1880855 RepID=UPI000C85FCF8|nr:hypothetical protein [Vibrio sp. 10N.286.49.B3]PMH46011.1 hypothetical protein BCU68_09480 [Vibrio sp. 10N.286.49.B3]
MKKTLLLAALISAAFNVSAQTATTQDIQEVNQVMRELVSVSGQEDIFASVHNEGTQFEYVDYQVVVHESLSKALVSATYAKHINLEKQDQFFVYGHDSLDKLNQEIIKKIEQDSPNFFSVDVYRNKLGKSDKFEYVAKVIEYK